MGLHPILINFSHAQKALQKRDIFNCWELSFEQLSWTLFNLGHLSTVFEQQKTHQNIFSSSHFQAQSD